MTLSLSFFTDERDLGTPPANRSRGGAEATVEVVIDEQGAVIAAKIAASINGFYDAVLLDSARTWRYRPATKDGRPVLPGLRPEFVWPKPA